MSKELLSQEKNNLLNNLYKLQELLGKENSSLQQRIKNIISKVSNLRFQVAIVGEFSTGKSSFLNALLGEEILPTALEECTAVITRIRKAHANTNIKLFYKKGNQENVSLNELEKVLTFESNIKEKLQEVCIELLDNKFLLDDVDFIDTPGVNDPTKTGDLITLHWLPQSDAVVFLTHCEQSFKKSEIDFLKTKVSTQDKSRFIFVIHASDLIENEKEFTSLKTRYETLLSKDYPSASVHFVSSHQALDAIEEQNKEEYVKSGLPSIRQDIHNLILKEKGKKHIQQFKQMTKLLQIEVERYLTTQLRTIEVEEELKDKMIIRKRNSIRKAQQEQRR